MRLLICGGAGYIGSHTCKLLASLGHEVLVYDNLYTGYREFAKYGDFVHGDIRDVQALRQVMHLWQPEGVIHFAALIAVGESVIDPGKYYQTNVAGTLNLLTAMQAEGIKNIVVSGTAAVYGQPEIVPIPETCPTLPINPYGESKLFMEKMLQSFKIAHDFRYVALRYFNACGCDPEGEIGERHKPETHLIPRALMSAAGLIPALQLFGDDYPTPDGTCIRDYIHVNDLAKAHVLAMEHLLKQNAGFGLALNLGTGQGLSVQTIVDTVKEVTGHDLPYVMAPRRAGDPPYLIAEPSLAKKILGWQANSSSAQEIISTAWNWFCKDRPNQCCR